MFQKLLLATDGSPHANRAAERTIQLAKQLGAFVLLLHISESAPARSELVRSDFDVKSLLEEHAHLAIVSTEKKLEREGISYQLEVSLGDPAEEIVRLSEERNCDLIVVGSRGLNRIEQVFMGSVSRTVAQVARCPVMIVKS